MAKRVALIIDDNQANLTIIQQELQRLGFNVTAVGHPNRIGAALETMAQIDIVLLDIEMPVMDGYEVHRQLRASGIEAPIVAHTVHTDEIHRLRAQEFNGLLSKPLDIDRLPDNLEKILGGKNIWLT
jgi:CheY-like chemotaxis protein